MALGGMTLAEYIRANDLTETAFAAKLGVNQSTVHRACKQGHIPSVGIMAAIFEETGGKVRPDDFYGVAQ